jgi:hypothetical protein
VRRTATAFTLTLAGLAAATGVAHAQAGVSITPVKPCYVNGDQVTAALSGFTPGGSATVLLDKQNLGSVPIDAAGAFTAPLTLGGFRGVKPHTLTATDTTNPALTATFGFRGAAHEVTVRPKKARAGKRLRLRGSGFAVGAPVYMHVRNHGLKTDKRVARAARGPCGTFRARTRVVPSDADSGRYRVQFDNKRRFSKRTKPKLVGSMTVTRRARSSAASIATARPGALTQVWNG